MECWIFSGSASSCPYLCLVMRCRRLLLHLLDLLLLLLLLFPLLALLLQAEMHHPLAGVERGHHRQRHGRDRRRFCPTLPFKPSGSVPSRTLSPTSPSPPCFELLAGGVLTTGWKRGGRGERERKRGLEGVRGNATYQVQVLCCEKGEGPGDLPNM